MQTCYCGVDLKEGKVYYSNSVKFVCPTCEGHYIMPGVPALAHTFPPYDNAPETGGETFGVCKFPKRHISQLANKITMLVKANKLNYVPYRGGLVYSEIDSENIVLFFSYAWDHGEVYDYLFTGNEGKSITGTKIQITACIWPGPEYKVFPKTLHRFHLGLGLDLLKFYPPERLNVIKRGSFSNKAFEIVGSTVRLSDGTRVFSLDPEVGLSVIIEYVPGMKPEGFYLSMKEFVRPEEFHGSPYFPKDHLV